MGKKKHKKKQKKAAQEQQAAVSGPSPLHRIGQVLLDQARSPAGRQLLATGLIVAASALARETTRREPEKSTQPELAPETDGPGTEPPKSGTSAKTGFSEAAAFAGMALSALDQFIHRSPTTDPK